ncbi:MAG: hypothetical protein HF314_06510 [Ignavibacteria bacterium]|jgi:hypothetical protein|nr:hypothetical protein [Ignavibacteria bacterium]MCU7502707.1 hypothetical protein [Ignavibacteria bacterium]MCU7517364.1 hypothetical protein [Ignavibacteria bacterium]
MAEVILEKSKEESCLIDKYEMCSVLGLSRATYYRITRKKEEVSSPEEKKPCRHPQELLEKRRKKRFFPY